jgi:hypothetical protein
MGDLGAGLGLVGKYQDVQPHVRLAYRKNME